MASFDLTWGLAIFGILNFLVLGGDKSSSLFLSESDEEESESKELLIAGAENLGFL